MTNEITLTDMEQAALNAIFKIGSEGNGAKTVEAMLADNFTWFFPKDLEEKLGINKNQAAGIMSALEAKGLAMDHDPNEKVAATWALTDVGIRLCQPDAPTKKFGKTKIAAGLDRNNAPHTFAKQRMKGDILKTQPEGSVAMTSGKGKFKDTIITTNLTENPRKPNTYGHTSFKIVMENQPITYADYCANGGRPNDLQWDLDHGYVEVVKATVAQPEEAPAAESEVKAAKKKG